MTTCPSFSWKSPSRAPFACGLAVVFVAFAAAQPGAAAAEPAPALPDAGALIIHDSFQGQLAPGWSFEREDPAAWRIAGRGLEVRVQPGNMWGGANNAKNVLVHPIPRPDEHPIEISVTISNQPTAQWEQANLVWFYDGGHMVKLGQELVTGRLSIVMGREEGDRARTIAIVPLDAHAVELRLQGFQNRVRGQFRTAPWSRWREVGECDLPVKGEPKASLHFYNGPAGETHWVRVNEFAVRRLPGGSADWPRERVQEKTLRAAGNPRVDRADIPLPGNFSLTGNLEALPETPPPACEQTIFRHRDGTFGWHWDRRSSASQEPAVAGVGWGKTNVGGHADAGPFLPTPLAAIRSLQLELDAVTRLENDAGDHTLVVKVPLKPAGELAIVFDWYGPASDIRSLHDGYREYGRVSSPSAPGVLRYRIRGFRGAPPKVNLKSFLDDAIQQGLAPDAQVAGVWFGNEIWNGSRGGTLVTQFDLLLNDIRHSSVTSVSGAPVDGR